MGKLKLEQHLCHDNNKLNFLEKIILYYFILSNNIKIEINEIDKVFKLNERKHTSVGCYTDLSQTVDYLMFDLNKKDNLHIILNGLVEIGYIFNIENNKIRYIECFTYGEELPIRITDIEIYEAKWNGNKKEMLNKIEKLPTEFEEFRILNENSKIIVDKSKKWYNPKCR